jgi:S-adenosylmethionine:tRNA ribosyltransferase-isomerase
LERLGEIPLPPYIRRLNHPTPEDATRYQTVYAQPPGSVAAPTAGLHFTPELLDELQSRGVQTAQVTLHVGQGTFTPVKEDDISLHKMHEEEFQITEQAAGAVNRAKRQHRRVIAVGTTSARVLESANTSPGGDLLPGAGRTRIFIYPPRNFRFVDAMITNFHLPRSTLLMLVSAFASPGRLEGREVILRAYAEAIQERYRFFSFGDAMLIQ